MNKTFSLFVLCFTVGICTAQVQPDSKSFSNSNQNQTKEVTPTLTPPSSRTPTGPNGFGPIKIGMSREAIVQLTEKDGVYLSSPMTTFIYRHGGQVEGVDQFDAKITTPLSSQPFSVILAFKGDELISLNISFERVSSVYDRTKAQIAEKFGPGKENNNRKDEQCIYRNGANFKVTSGSIISTWVDEVSVDSRIETRMSDWISNMCPSSLRSISVGEVGVKSISIRKIQNSKEAEKVKSLF